MLITSPASNSFSVSIPWVDRGIMYTLNGSSSRYYNRYWLLSWIVAYSRTPINCGFCVLKGVGGGDDTIIATIITSFNNDYNVRGKRVGGMAIVLE